jgi:hypothetical protein
MKRMKTLVCEVTTYDTQVALRITLKREDIGPVCLELGLLRHALSDALIISAHDGQAKVEIVCDKKLGSEQRAVLERKKTTFYVRISLQELDYWIEWFLEDYRDGQSPVDHFDVDIPREATNLGKSVYVTWRFPNVGRQLTPREAERMMEEHSRKIKGDGHVF